MTPLVVVFLVVAFLACVYALLGVFKKSANGAELAVAILLMVIGVMVLLRYGR